MSYSSSNYKMLRQKFAVNCPGQLRSSSCALDRADECSCFCVAQRRGWQEYLGGASGRPCAQANRPCLLIDDDPQGSLTLWNELRAESALPLRLSSATSPISSKRPRGTAPSAIFIDTPPNNSVSVIEAIEAATLVIIPCRPGLFDIDAVQETIAFSRQVRTPYAVVFNAAPPRRHETEAPAVTLARRCLAQLKVPVLGRSDHSPS